MLYFFHHYELPVILQQAQLQHLLFRNHAQAGMAEQPSPEQPISNRALTEPTPEPSPARESTTENQAQQATPSAQQGPESTNPANAEERVEATPSSSTNEEQSNEGNQRESKFFHNRFHLSCVCVCVCIFVSFYSFFFLFVLADVCFSFFFPLPFPNLVICSNFWRNWNTIDDGEFENESFWNCLEIVLSFYVFIINLNFRSPI